MFINCSSNIQVIEKIIENPILIPQNKIINILIMASVVITIILLCGLFFKPILLIGLYLFTFIVTLTIMIIIIKTKTLIKDSENRIKNKIDELESTEKLIVSAGLNPNNIELMNAMTDLEKIITILQSHFQHDNNMNIFSLLVEYITKLQDLNTSEIEQSIKLLTSYDITELQNILNKIESYTSNQTTINDIQNVLIFLDKYGDDLVFWLQLFTTMNNSPISPIINIITLFSRLSENKIVDLNENTNILLSTFNIEQLNNITNILNNIKSLQDIYHIPINSDFFHNFTNKINIDLQNIHIAENIISLINLMPINSEKTISSLYSSVDLISILYTLKEANQFIIDHNLNLNSLNLLTNTIVDSSFKISHDTLTTLIEISNKLNIPLADLTQAITML